MLQKSWYAFITKASLVQENLNAILLQFQMCYRIVQFWYQNLQWSSNGKVIFVSTANWAPWLRWGVSANLEVEERRRTCCATRCEGPKREQRKLKESGETLFRETPHSSFFVGFYEVSVLLYSFSSDCKNSTILLKRLRQFTEVDFAFRIAAVVKVDGVCVLLLNGKEKSVRY